jgi:hypothetical protein
LGPPSPASECCPPFGSRGDTLAGGGERDPIPTKGQTLWYSMVAAVVDTT